MSLQVVRQKKALAFLSNVPAIKNNVELTNEIKEYILNNRIYIIPKQEPQIQQPIINNQIINNYQQINNLISGINSVDKINKYIKYKNIELVDIDETINFKKT